MELGILSLVNFTKGTTSATEESRSSLEDELGDDALKFSLHRSQRECGLGFIIGFEQVGQYPCGFHWGRFWDRR